jgi:DNA-binding NtrC family response regulator
MLKKLRNKSILIVDDDAGMLRAVSKVLASEGADVTCAEWAGDAMEILTGLQKELDRIDLVITDLRMPFVTGLTLVYAIHKISPHLPVIVLTGLGGADIQDECVRQGAAAVLEKPLDTPRLLETIDKVFENKKKAAK